MCTKKRAEIKCKEAEVIICMVFFSRVRTWIYRKWDIRHITIIVKEELKK